MTDDTARILPFEELGQDDVARVGGKNASLGEMTRSLAEAGVAVPPGFATTAAVYWEFLDDNDLRDEVQARLDALEAEEASLAETGRALRRMIEEAPWPEDAAEAIRDAYATLCDKLGEADAPVAVRSSATAEDLPDASFAGQHESFLGVQGAEALLDACRRCIASLFTDRAIAYRKEKGFDHMKVALSVGVQAMVRSGDPGGCSGVMFTLDTETGFPRVTIIDGAWGVGETVVQGRTDPDGWQVFKPLLEDEGLSPIIQKRLGAKLRKMVRTGGKGSEIAETDTTEEERASFVLSDAEVLRLARWSVAVEDHYGRPMDIEWARDGETGDLWIVQARPETVQSRRKGGALRSVSVGEHGRELVSGLAIGDGAATGKVRVIASAAEIDRFEDGAVLVTETTDPDWVPIMKRAAAIVTDRGGRTSHAAIVSRELGLPAVVGCGNAMEVLEDGAEVTVSCAEGATGRVYEGEAEIESEMLDPDDAPKTQTEVMLNLADPDGALRWWRLPADGVGLARMEFVISNHVRIHPMALAHFDRLEDEAVREKIEELTARHEDKAEYFVDRLSRGLSRIAAVVHPKPCIVRMSDFKTNEYAGLIGGAAFEPEEENPMLGFRGAARYASDRYRDGFALECRAIRRLREEMGFRNVVVMIPFCRSPAEADGVLEAMAENGLKRGEAGLEVYVMTEIPSNVILAERFAERFDGFSIGSNDLTQLTLGVDRDSPALARSFDERDPAVKWLIERMVSEARRLERHVGLCGQGPSDHPEFAQFLVECGIDSISVAPDSFLKVKRQVAEAEGRRRS